jgi:hypothetical protein
MEAIDPTRFDRRLLSSDAAHAGSFDADGGWLDFATTRPLHWLGALPRSLGFALAPLANARRDHEPLRRETGVCSGATSQSVDAPALDLPAEVATWGEPTGIAVEPDGSGFVLGQRRGDDDGVHERLVGVQLACTQAAVVPRTVSTP